MLVSQLIKFRDDVKHRIALLEQDPGLDISINLMDSILQENADVDKFSAHTKIENIIAGFSSLRDQLNTIKKQAPDIIDDINEAIDQLAAQLLTKPDDEPFKYYFKTEFTLDQELEIAIRANIHKYSNWYFPALQLGCRSDAKKFTSELIANDPLYICDYDMDYISDVTSQFNTVYNNRIRKYVLSGHDLLVLPQNQFGFILCWSFFNYVGIGSVEKYLENLLKLLRPGGTLMFSYNNGDIFDCCKLTESGGMSFISNRKILEICNKIGYVEPTSYDMINSDPDVKHISWIEIKKPGELLTTKRSQARGKILTK